MYMGHLSFADEPHWFLLASSIENEPGKVGWSADYRRPSGTNSSKSCILFRGFWHPLLVL